MARKSDNDSRVVLEPKPRTLFDKYFEWYQSIPQSNQNQNKFDHGDGDSHQNTSSNEKYELAWVWCPPKDHPNKKIQETSNWNQMNTIISTNIYSSFAFDGNCRFATATTNFSPIQTNIETANACLDNDTHSRSAKVIDPSNPSQTNSISIERKEKETSNQNVFIQTNLSLLYERYEKKLDNQNTNPKYQNNKDSSVVYYDPKHPSLAPIIDVIDIHQKNSKIDSQIIKNNENIPNDETNHSHIICIHDISPCTHRPLHSFVRSEQFLQNPILPPSLYSYFISNDLNDKVKEDGEDRHKNINHVVKSLLKLPIFQKAKRKAVKHKKKPKEKQQYYPHHYNKKKPNINLDFTNLQRQHDTDIKIRFIMLQLLHTVSFCHSKNINLTQTGALHPKQIFVQDDGWIRIVIPVQKIYNTPRHNEDPTLHSTSDLPDNENIHQSETSNDSLQNKDSKTSLNSHHGYNKILLTNRIQHYPGMDDSATRKWRNGTISNLTYLMLLNESAGRTIQDLSNPPILPWVTDFSQQILDLDGILGTQGMGAWRDLSKSKYRITKGDIQVDHSFQNALPSHHIPEALSEISYCVYKARCTPLHVLQSKVRPSFIPEHYPDSVAKMYQWTPDESILEFYSKDVTPNIFQSRHKSLGLNDLILPKWCDGIDDFIAYHRRLLESDAVSRYLHLWIDLNFGEALAGDRSIKEKNVPLKIQSFHKIEAKAHDEINPSDKIFFESCFTFVQLFRKAHPRRKIKCQSKMPNDLEEKYSSFAKLNSTLKEAKRHQKMPIENNNLSEDQEVGSSNKKPFENNEINDEPRKQSYTFNSSRLSHQYLIDDLIQNSIDKTDSEDLRHLDFISIGMVIREIYHVVDMIPPPDVKSAIYVLLTGYTGIQHLLWSHQLVNGSFRTNKVNPSISNKAFKLFPAYLQYTFFSLADAQYFERDFKVATTTTSFFCEKMMKVSTYNEIIKILQFGSDASNLKQISFNGLGILLPKIKNAIVSILSCLDDEILPITDDRHVHMTQALCKFVDSFGHYIGKKGSDQYLLSPMMCLLTDASEMMDKYGKFLYTLLVSPFLSSLYHNSTMEIFIRKVFPFLIQLLIRDETFCEKEKTLNSAKKAASIALTSLVQENTLLPLYNRFIVPSFIENITDFNTFFSDVVTPNKFENSSFSDIGHLPTEIVCKSHVTESLEAIISFLPYQTVKIKICQNILKIRIPHLLNKIHNEMTSTEEKRATTDCILMVGTLAQIISIVITCVPILDPVDIYRLFFKEKNTIVHQIVHLALSNVLRDKDQRQINRNIASKPLPESIGSSAEIMSPVIKNSESDQESLKKKQWNEGLLQTKVSCYFLNQVSTLICALIRTMELELLPKTILPVVEAFSVRLMREYETELGDNSVTYSVNSNLSQEYKLEYILSFPGIVEKNYMYDTLFEVCGKTSMSKYCPSLLKISTWIIPIHEGKCEVILEEKKSIDVSNI